MSGIPWAISRQHAEQPVEPLAGAVFRYELVDPQPAIAIRVANVPKEEFERQVESDNPPTITDKPITAKR